MAKKFIKLQEAECLLKRIGAPTYAINELALAPTYDMVHRSVFDQCAWERDLAITQLRNDYGVGLGEKKPADVVKVVRCSECKHFGGHGVCHCHAADENGTPIFVRPNDFCSYGERRDNNA